LEWRDQVPRRAPDSFRIDIDLDFAQREAERIRALLLALRRRHDLARYEYTRLVRIVPGSETFSHPVLTLGNRFAENEDLLLSTYLHEQMHWYLWLLGTPDYDPVAPFFDELVRRYPDAPIKLPEGARNYESTYLHLVVNWLEISAASEFIGRTRASTVADTQWGQRWIYRTVLKDWDRLGELYERHGIVPIRNAEELRAENAKFSGFLGDARRRTPSGARRPAAPRSRPRPRARGGRSAG
jgi:hypothetical protein